MGFSFPFPPYKNILPPAPPTKIRSLVRSLRKRICRFLGCICCVSFVMPPSLSWILRKLWQWDVLPWVAALFYAAGISSMYGNDFIIAAMLYFVAIVLIAAKAYTEQEINALPYGGGIKLAIVIIGAIIFGLSLLWIEHRRSRSTLGATPQGTTSSGGAPIRPNIAAKLIIDTVSDQYINFHFHVENAVDSPEANDIRYSIKTPDAFQKEFIPPMERTLQPGGQLSLSSPPFFLHPRDYNSVLLTLIYGVELESVHHEFTSSYRFFFDRSHAKEGNAIEPEEFKQQEVNTSPKPERNPGQSLQIHVRINNLPEKRRKYLFDFGKIEGPRLSIYISPENIFTMSFTNPSRELYSVQIPVGAGGIPIGDFIFLTCEIGVGAQTSTLRVLLDGKPIIINGKDAGFLELPFRVDVAALDVPNGVVGADLKGSNGSSIDLLELAMYSATLPKEDIQNFRQYFNGRPHTPFVQFNGNQWMRVKAVGRHDLEQTEKSHRPTFRK